MGIDFTPQFHRKLSENNGGNVWVAIPHPETLIPFKTMYYHTWQQEECTRLRSSGEEVIALAISH